MFTYSLQVSKTTATFRIWLWILHRNTFASYAQHPHNYNLFCQVKTDIFFPHAVHSITLQSQNKILHHPKEYALILPHESYKAALICFPNLNYVIFSSVCIMENEQQQPSLVRIGCFFRECRVHGASLSPGVKRHFIRILTPFSIQTLNAAVKGYKIYLSVIA